MLLVGCRLHFDDASSGDGGRGDGRGADAAVSATCDRTPVTTPTFWADTNLGLDTNPGTQAAPTKTIARALALATSGGTVIVGPGNYGETLDVSSTFPLLLLSAGRYTARIQRFNCQDCSDVTIDGFEITGTTLPLLSITAGTRVTVHDNVLDTGPTAGIRVTSGSQTIAITNNVVYDSYSTAIHVNDAIGVTIENNVVFGDQTSPDNEARLWLEAATDTLVAGNVLFRRLGNDTTYGVISLRATAGNTVLENNIVGGSPNATNVYAPIGFDMGAGNAVIRHNTFAGPLPGAASAFGLGCGAVLAGGNYVLVNNLWASPGTTQPFTVGNAPVGTVSIRRNLYWNAPNGPFAAGGSPTPAGDSEAIIADPGIAFVLPAAPVWTGTSFVGGATTTGEVHAQLVEALARIAPGSPATGAADSGQTPTFDVRGHLRPTPAAVGAYDP